MMEAVKKTVCQHFEITFYSEFKLPSTVDSEYHSRNISITGESSRAHLRGIAEAGMNIESKEAHTIELCRVCDRQQAYNHSAP